MMCMNAVTISVQHDSMSREPKTAHHKTIGNANRRRSLHGHRQSCFEQSYLVYFACLAPNDQVSASSARRLKPEQRCGSSITAVDVSLSQSRLSPALFVEAEVADRYNSTTNSSRPNTNLHTRKDTTKRFRAVRAASRFSSNRPHSGSQDNTSDLDRNKAQMRDRATGARVVKACLFYFVGFLCR